MTVTTSPLHRGEHEVSRKAIAQGMSECFRCPVCSCAPNARSLAHETAGAACTRHSLRSLFRRGTTNLQNLGRNAPRDCERTPYPPRRPGERRDPYAAAEIVRTRWSTALLQQQPTVAMGPCFRRDDSETPHSTFA